MAKVKVREHKEWFRKLTTRTCDCGNKKTDVYSWGEYHGAKWRTIDYVCEKCWINVQKKLLSHKDDCGCKFTLVGKNCKLPSWLNLDLCIIPQALPVVKLLPVSSAFSYTPTPSDNGSSHEVQG